MKSSARTLDTVIVLAIDTATPAVTAGVVRVDHPTAVESAAVESAAVDPTAPRPLVETLAERVTVDARAHGELLTPHLRAALDDVGLDFDQVDAVVCGTGPGPFTGLRVGMVTAASLGHALGIPVHGVCSLDAIAVDAVALGTVAVGDLLVVTDARRREVYWAAYDHAGHRLAGPDVRTPATLAEQLSALGVTSAAGDGARQYADVLGLPVIEPAHPSPAGLVTVAVPHLLGTEPPAPFLPLYLRRPDAVEPGARKKVTA